MRFISSSRASMSSVRCAFLDFGASALRSFSSAFSTESLGVSAMATSYPSETRSASWQPRRGAGDQQNGRDGIKPSQPIAKLACSASDPAQGSVDLDQQESASQIALFVAPVLGAP